MAWKRAQKKHEKLKNDGVKGRQAESIVSAPYMPGSSRRTLSQDQVRNGPLWLVSPLQGGSVVQSEVAVRQQQRIKEHRHGIGWSPFQPFTEILQVLQRGLGQIYPQQTRAFLLLGPSRLPAPAATGEAAPTACCAAGGSGAVPRVTGRGCNPTAGRTGRCPTGRYLGDRDTMRSEDHLVSNFTDRKPKSWCLRVTPGYCTRSHLHKDFFHIQKNATPL